MSMLITAGAVFIAIHLLVAGTRLRDAITNVIGERAYLGLFSFASLVVIIWLVMSFNAAQRGMDPLLYNLGEGVKHIGIPVVALAFFLGVQGLLLPNPTTVGLEGQIGREDVIQGVMRITRHPFLWGVALWSAFHFAANGDEASVIFFGTFFVVSFFGTFSIDAKRRRKMGEAWNVFAAKTSNIPFAAAISGRNSLKIGQSFGWRFWVAAAIFVVALFAHAHVIGVSPFPGGVVPI